MFQGFKIIAYNNEYSKTTIITQNMFFVIWMIFFHVPPWWNSDPKILSEMMWVFIEAIFVKEQLKLFPIVENSKLVSSVIKGMHLNLHPKKGTVSGENFCDQKSIHEISNQF